MRGARRCWRHWRKSFSALGAEVAIYPLDVTDVAALAAAGKDFIARFGAPEVVIANAGVSAGTLTEHAEDLAVFRRIVDTNLLGMAATFAPFIAAMRDAVRTEAQAISAGGSSASRRLPVFAACPAPRPQRLEGGGDCLSGKPAAGDAARRHPRGDDRARLHRDADDRNQPYPMPFLVPADTAARRFAAAIARGTSYTVIPGRWASLPGCCGRCRTGCTTACLSARRASRDYNARRPDLPETDFMKHLLALIALLGAAMPALADDKAGLAAVDKLGGLNGQALACRQMDVSSKARKR